VGFSESQILAARTEALRIAAQQGGDRGEILDTADWYLRWLLARTTRLQVHVSALTWTQGDPSKYEPTRFVELEGGLMAVSMADNEYVTLTVDPEDARGNPSSDAGITWASDDSGQFVTLTPSADGTQVNVGAVGPLGTANVTPTDASGIAGTAEAFTIVAGGTTSLAVSASAAQVIPSTGVPVPAGASAAPAS
jgi:hypothetical protein